MVTLADVKKVADDIASKGGSISVRTVHQRTRGSFRDVSRYLAKWREDHPSVTATATSGDTLPRSEHERMLRDAEARLDGERRHLMMQTDAIRQGIGAPYLMKIETLEAKVVELQRELLMAEARRDEAERRANRAEQALLTPSSRR